MNTGAYRYTDSTGRRVFIRARAVTDGPAVAAMLTELLWTDVAWIPG